jgi:hypothetical protein
MSAPITFFKVSCGPQILFESLSKEDAVSFAQRYYSNRRVIPEITEFLRTPVDHTR